jgi:predicted double-glycine peptidase
VVRLASLAALAAVPALAFGSPRAVRSMLELRQDGVVRQGWDLSCGAAALSTLLGRTLGDPVGEAEIVAALLRGADADRIRARGGFSLLDLKRYAVARGYAAAGYGGLDLATLAALGPAIVPTEGRAGPHFVVYRGVTRGRVVLSDPAYGERTLPLESFEALWTPRVAFVVARPGQGAPPPTPGNLSDEALRRAVLVPPRAVRSAVSSAVLR